MISDTGIKKINKFMGQNWVRLELDPAQFSYEKVDMYPHFYEDWIRIRIR
jgi:hypothetical protein